MSLLRNIFLLLMFCVFVGCGNADENKVLLRAYEQAVGIIEERILRKTSLTGDSVTPERFRQIKEIELPFLRKGLNNLNSVGPDALKRPFVIMGLIYPSPNPEQSLRPGTLAYSHVIMLEWFEMGNEVTGFYLESDEDVYDFRNAINPSDEHLVELAKTGPGRDEQVFLSQIGSTPARRLFRWPEGLYEKVIEERRIRAIGLILKDGTRTESGPFGYSMQ